MTAVSHTCRSCHAPIWWVETEQGKRMPVDPDPVPDGNVVVVRAGVGLAPAVVRVLGAGEMLLDEPPRYVSHFVTCRYADAHRRPR